MKPRTVRLLCILSVLVVPILVYSRFENALGAVAGGVWVVAVLSFLRWYSRGKQ